MAKGLPNRGHANLLRGGKKGHRGANQASWRTGDPTSDKAAQKMALKLLSSPKYRKTLQAKLNDCSLHPSVHVTLLYFAYGRPKEIVEQVQNVPVKIEHVYSKE